MLDNNKKKPLIPIHTVLGPCSYSGLRVLQGKGPGLNKGTRHQAIISFNQALLTTTLGVLRFRCPSNWEDMSWILTSWSLCSNRENKLQNPQRCRAKFRHSPLCLFEFTDDRVEGRQGQETVGLSRAFWRCSRLLASSLSSLIKDKLQMWETVSTFSASKNKRLIWLKTMKKVRRPHILPYVNVFTWCDGHEDCTQSWAEENGEDCFAVAAEDKQNKKTSVLLPPTPVCGLRVSYWYEAEAPGPSVEITSEYGF